MMTMHRGPLALAKLASSDVTRQNLACVRFAHGRVEATDGHLLGRVTIPGENGIGVCVPAADVARVAKAMPKGGTVTVDVATDGPLDARSEDRTVRFVTSDGTRVDVPASPDNFPDTDQIFPSGEPLAVIGLSAKLLGSILDAAIAVRGPNARSYGVRLSVYDKDGLSPIKIDIANPDTGEEAAFLLMPMRL